MTSVSIAGVSALAEAHLERVHAERVPVADRVGLSAVGGG